MEVKVNNKKVFVNKINKQINNNQKYCDVVFDNETVLEYK